MKTSRILMLTTLFILLNTMSHATQEIRSASAPPSLDEIIVSATKTEEKVKDIPNAVILIDAETIQESPARTLGEILADELGIDWRTYGDYGGASGTIQIRGMSANGTQILVNGVNIASPSLGTTDVSKIPLNSIERIEVVKGSGSLLYGSGAMGGTINIITKNPKKDRTMLKASAGIGSQNTYELTAENGMFLSNDFGYYLTAGRRETDGFRDNSDLTHNDVSLKLVWDKGEVLNLSLYGDWIDREYGRPGVKPPDGINDYYVGDTLFYNADSANLLARGSDKDQHIVFQLKSRPLDWIILSGRADYSRLENYDLDRYIDFDNNLAGTKLWVTNIIQGIEANANIRANDKFGILIGADHKNYDWENESFGIDAGEEEIPETRNAFDATVRSTGYYLEAQYRPLSYIKGIAGVRQEDHSAFGTETLPLFGIIVNPSSRTVLKINHGKHFLAPTPNDLFWPYQDFGYYSFQGNPDLKPETGWHSDATLEHRFLNDKVAATLSYFKWDINDKIEWQADESWHYRPVNLDSFTGDGWEAGLRIGPYLGLQVSLSYTYTDANEENSYVTRRASYTPEHQFKSSITHWADFGLTTQFTARYVGNRYYYGGDKKISEPVGTLDSYWIADIRFTQRLYEHWSIALTGNNLFDKHYETYLNPFYDFVSGETTLVGFPGSGRSIFLGITYEL